MTPAETGLVIDYVHTMTDTIYSVKDSFVNIYVIERRKQYLVIDGGNSIEGITSGLMRLKICPDDVVAILLTHSDGDHVKALNLFPKADIYLSKQEEQMINGKTSRFIFFKNSIPNRKYNTLEDNQIFTLLNYKIQGILVPGHTPGSMCYLIDDKYLFTGDALSLKNGKIGRFNQFFNMDSEEAAKSMEKLTNLPHAHYIFTAHHGYSENYEDAVSNWGK